MRRRGFRARSARHHPARASSTSPLAPTPTTPRTRYDVRPRPRRLRGDRRSTRTNPIRFLRISPRGARGCARARARPRRSPRADAAVWKSMSSFMKNKCKEAAALEATDKEAGRAAWIELDRQVGARLAYVDSSDVDGERLGVLLRRQRRRRGVQGVRRIKSTSRRTRREYETRDACSTLFRASRREGGGERRAPTSKDENSASDVSSAAYARFAPSFSRGIASSQPVGTLREVHRLSYVRVCAFASGPPR